MKVPSRQSGFNKHDLYQRQDAIKQFMRLNSQTRLHRKKYDISSASNDNSFSRLNQVKLNKGKKFLLQEQRNTEIQRSNRILHEKLTRCARRSQTNVIKASRIDSMDRYEKQQTKSRSKGKIKKRKAVITLPTIQNEHKLHRSSINGLNKAMTLFMGHSHIDGVQFKIKILITDGVYYLIAQNQHTKIVLEMPEQQYWQLHYHELQENPCNIFIYLQIQKGQISFRVKNSKKAQRQGMEEMDNGRQQVVRRRKKSQNREVGQIYKVQKLPKI